MICREAGRKNFFYFSQVLLPNMDVLFGDLAEQ